MCIYDDTDFELAATSNMKHEKEHSQERYNSANIVAREMIHDSKCTKTLFLHVLKGAFWIWASNYFIKVLKSYKNPFISDDGFYFNKNHPR